jgi:hypothetical protein
MKSLSLTIKSLFGITLLLLLVGAWVGPAAAAPVKQEEQPQYPRLEYGLRWALLRLDIQQDHLDAAHEGGNLIEEIIADLQAAGKDTSALEAALAEFRASLDEAQALHDEAAQILDDKAGFNDAGEVEDPEQARDTLRSAGQSLRRAGQTLHQARRDLHQVLRQHRRDRSNKTD